MLLLRFAGVLVLRFATRQFSAELFQLPPRINRAEPDGLDPKSSDDPPKKS
jgi:hypothetical protein